MRLYGDLAPWWPLLSPPAGYADEAARYLDLLRDAVDGELTSLLELGSGGGHLASHLPTDLEVVLTDRSADMLHASRRLNPDREHVRGDFRALRLGRAFDAVLLHDAVMYVTREDDLRDVFATAAAHLRPGGVLLVLPDVVAETFAPATHGGGSDAPDGRGARLLEWHHDPDPGDHTFRVDFACLLRHPDGTVDAVHESHTMGLFDRSTYWAALGAAGLQPVEADPVLAVEIGEVFLARRPGA